MGKRDFPSKKPRFDEDDEEFFDNSRGGKGIGGYDNPAYESSDPLFLVYNIMPELPFATKVEKLMVGWGMEAGEIAEVLSEDTSRVRNTMEDIQARWLNLGAGLSSEDRKMARGRLIAEYQELVRQIDQLQQRTPDYKHVQLKHSLLEKIAKLQGVDVDKKDLPKDVDEATGGVESAVGSLSAAATRELLRRLTEGESKPSDVIPVPERRDPVPAPEEATIPSAARPKYPILKLDE